KWRVMWRKAGKWSSGGECAGGKRGRAQLAPRFLLGIFIETMLYSVLDGGLDVCVDLIGPSPLTQTGMVDFVSDSAVIEDTQRKYINLEAKNIIVTECSDLLQKVEDKAYHFPALITSLEGKQCIFQFHFNPSSNVGQVEFIFDNILNQTLAAITPTFDNPLALMALVEESSGSSTTIVEKMCDISTLSVMTELHLADKSSISRRLGVTLMCFGEEIQVRAMDMVTIRGAPTRGVPRYSGATAPEPTCIITWRTP
nr:hypothetical protein [Tanacetum cinerariifolium]